MFIFGAAVLAVFTFASALSKSEQRLCPEKCSNFLKISTDVITLATLRAIQGIGAAAMVPASVSPHFAIFMDLFAQTFI